MGAAGEGEQDSPRQPQGKELFELLVERGAAIDPLEKRYGGAPIGFAHYHDRQSMLGFLSRYSRNVWMLALRGYVERLRDVLAEAPELARATNAEGLTPLWWMPDDEPRAIEIARLLLTNGADPAVRSRSGRTAADWRRNAA